MNIILKGPKMRNMKEYKDPDILHVNIDNTDMYYNKINLEKNAEKCIIFHVYHGQNNYKGSYYHLDFDKKKLKIKQNTIEFKIEKYENEVDYTQKTVTVKITFSDIGSKKMQDFLSHFKV